MDSTNPDLGAFKARGGKLIMLEYMADYAQSPYAGIGYFEQVQKRMGEAAIAEFARLYAAPGVDHVGSGAPSSVDMLSGSRRLGGKRPRTWRSRRRRTAARAADHGRPLAAAVPVAGLAAIQGGRSEKRGQLRLRAVMRAQSALGVSQSEIFFALAHRAGRSIAGC